MEVHFHQLKRLEGELAELAPRGGDAIIALALRDRLAALRQSLVAEHKAIGLKLDHGRLRRRALSAYRETAK